MDTKSIREYGAAPDLEKATHAAERFLQTVGGLRGELGEKHDLLDEFVKCVLHNFVEVICIATDGVDVGVFADLQRFCRLIREWKKDAELKELNHPLFEKVAAFIGSHDLPQNSLFNGICCAGLLPDFLPFTLEQYIAEFDKNLEDVMIKNGVPEAHDALSAEIGRDRTNALYDAILDIFIVISPASIFVQAILEDIAMSLINPNMEGGNYVVFQYMLDNRLTGGKGDVR